jgi:hypothetical protein
MFHRDDPRLGAFAVGADRLRGFERSTGFALGGRNSRRKLRGRDLLRVGGRRADGGNGGSEAPGAKLGASNVNHRHDAGSRSHTPNREADQGLRMKKFIIVCDDGGTWRANQCASPAGESD